MKKLEVNVDIPYPIYIENGLLQKLGEYLPKKAKKICIITDSNVLSNYAEILKDQVKGSGYDSMIIALPAGESSKNFDNLSKIYEQMLNFKLTRSDLVIAMGGGVIGDLAGFVSASYLRGIDFIQIPTSLLAMVDSSVGGKVCVNLPQGKNLIGAFYHPKAVFIDPNVLSTLPHLYFTDGMSEVIKYGCIFDKDFFDLLNNLTSREQVITNIEHIIYTCCDLKRKVVEEDEKDTGNRMLLNFGHSLAHAIENFHNYTGITHGHAVAIGMYTTTLLAERAGISKETLSDQIKNILLNHNLPITLSQAKISKIDDTIKSAISNDKKNINGKLKEIVLDKIGTAKIIDIDLDLFYI